MPRIVASRPFNRRPLPPLWDGGGARRSSLGASTLGPRGRNVKLTSLAGSNYIRAMGDIAAGSLPCPSGSGYCPPFNASVELWRDDVAAQAGTKPVDFLLAWMQVESNGNPCSWTSLAEAGVFQLMNGDNLVQGGTTLAQQHPVPPCVSGSQTTAYRTSLTDDQAHEQVRAGMQYIGYCISKVDAMLGLYGYADQPGWTDSDWSYWAMVKMVHVAPATLPGMLTAGLKSGGIPADWDQMMTYVTGIPASWTDNARKVGVFGAGGGSVLSAITNDPFVPLAIGGLVALWFLTRSRSNG